MNAFFLKYLIFRAIGSACIGGASNNGCRILMYHSLSADVDNDTHGIYKINKDSFKDQVLSLVNNSAHNFIPLCDWSINSKGLVVTFDDGFLDTLLIAAPILSKYNIPFSVFVSPGLVKLNDKRYLDKGALLELSKVNDCTIGAHGYSHCRLSECDNKKLNHELMGSKQWLEDTLSIPINTMSYPFGSVNSRVRDAAHDAGYKVAVSSHPGNNFKKEDPLCLNRTDIWSVDNINVFNQKVNGCFDWIRLFSRN